MISLLKEDWEIKIFKFFKNKFSFQKPGNQLRIVNSSSVNIGVLDCGESPPLLGQGIELTFKKQHYCKIPYQAQFYCWDCPITRIYGTKYSRTAFKKLEGVWSASSRPNECCFYSNECVPLKFTFEMTILRPPPSKKHSLFQLKNIFGTYCGSVI